MIFCWDGGWLAVLGVSDEVYKKSIKVNRRGGVYWNATMREAVIMRGPAHILCMWKELLNMDKLLDQCVLIRGGEKMNEQNMLSEIANFRLSWKIWSLLLSMRDIFMFMKSTHPPTEPHRKISLPLKAIRYALDSQVNLRWCTSF